MSTELVPLVPSGKYAVIDIFPTGVTPSGNLSLKTIGSVISL